MAMEKRGVIEDGWTPPETSEKKADQLEEHVTKRAADAASEKTADDKQGGRCRCGCNPSCRGRRPS